MRILIASDLHGSVPALEFLKAKVQTSSPDLLLLLGDLVYHGPRNSLPHGYDTRTMLESFPALTGAQLACMRGNCDAEVDVAQLPFPLTPSMWLAADGLRIFASHGHHLPENPPMLGFDAGTVFLRGHTHIPRAETVAGYHFWNPGSLGLPKGGFPASYGWYEDGSFSVFDTRDTLLMRHSVPPDPNSV